jgi:hypothetical protein
VCREAKRGHLVVDKVDLCTSSALAHGESMVIFKCPYCRAEYELTTARLSFRQRSHAKCHVCDPTMYSWTSRNVPLFNVRQCLCGKDIRYPTVTDASFRSSGGEIALPVVQLGHLNRAMLPGVSLSMVLTTIRRPLLPGPSPLRGISAFAPSKNNRRLIMLEHTLRNSKRTAALATLR